MSFSRAKIKRFNDIISYGPPVGTYDPKICGSKHNSIFSKTERFKEMNETDLPYYKSDTDIIKYSRDNGNNNVYRTPKNFKKKINATCQENFLPEKLKRLELDIQCKETLFKKQIQQLNEKLNELTSELAGKIQENSFLIDENSRITKEITCYDETTSKKIIKFQNEIEELESFKLQVEGKQQSLTDKIKQLKLDIQNKEILFKEQTQRISDKLNESSLELKKEKQKNVLLIDEYNSIKEQIVYNKEMASKRLIELQKNIKDLETFKSQNNHECQKYESQIKKLEEELELERRKASELKTYNFELQDKLNDIKEIFKKDKIVSEDQINMLKVDLEEYKNEYDKLCDNYKEAQEIVNGFQLEIQQMTSYINTKENEIKNINNLLEQNSNNQQQILKEYDDNYKLKISSFKEQLSQESEETYNKLKICETTLDEANKQIIVLKVEKENLAKLNAKVTKELKNFELEQADTMGHHNHKQKIRHVITLKEENLKLNDELNKVKHDLKKKDQLLKAYEDKMNRLEGKKKFDPKLAFQCHILKEVNENKENIL